jgi:folate-binding protein YgfZ
MSKSTSALSDWSPVRLAGRGVVDVRGAEAAAFLHNLVSANVEKLADGEATYAALLTPQGKILFDFIVVRAREGFILDVAREQAAALAKRLGFYKLRSQVVIADRSDALAVIAGPSRPLAGLPTEAIVFTDPRLDTLGARAIAPAASVVNISTDATDYERLRVRLAVPAFGQEFQGSDVVPHDVNFDDLNAIDFRKGCYVGQEIVSRMKHRGTARRRLVHVRPASGASSPLPDRSTEILAGHRSIGTMGSSIGGDGLAILRLDWAKDAIDRGIPITANGIALDVELPAYASFKFPETVVEG